MVDGRWTLAFKDEQACKAVESMIMEEINAQRDEVERRLKPTLQLDTPGHTPEHTTTDTTDD